MLIRKIVRSTASASGLMVLIVATAMVAFPVPSRATDITWHSRGEPAVWNNANYERKGTVDFKTGETGSFISYGTNRPTDKGLTPFVSQYVLRFDDLSSIIVRMAGNFDEAIRVAKGSGEILGGTGRFEGITGKVTVVSRFSGGSAPEMDWTGSYSLPSDSRISQ